MKKIDLCYAALTVAFFILTWLTLSGDVQKVIHFTGPLNEMGFCFMTLAAGCLSLVMTFNNDKK